MFTRAEPTDFTREQRLCLLAAVPGPSETVRATMSALLQQKIDWQSLLSLADRHGMAPLLHARLAPRDSIPAAITSALLERVGHGIALARTGTASLHRVVRALVAAEIEAVAFKGPVLAAECYESPSLRGFSDLDILVSPTQARAAHDVLTDLGYRPALPVPRAYWDTYLRSNKEATYVQPGHPPVDLHWNLFNRRLGVRCSTRDVLARARIVSLPGGDVRALHLEDRLLYLCVHGCCHFWNRLIWLADVARVLDRFAQAIDTERFVARARAWSTERMVALALRLAGDLLGAQAPSPGQMRQVPRALVFSVRRRIFGEEPSKTQALVLGARMRERWGDRIRLASEAVFTPTANDLSMIYLPRPLAPFYSVLRVLRLAGRWLASPWRRAQ